MEEVKLAAENLGFIAKMNKVRPFAMEDPKFLKLLDDNNRGYADLDLICNLVVAWNNGYNDASSEYRRYDKHAKFLENAR
jgi:hypothetical protein